MEALWNRLSYLDFLADHVSDYTQEEYYALVNYDQFGMDTLINHPLDEGRIYARLSS
jgi:hypothetical protein